MAVQGATPQSATLRIRSSDWVRAEGKVSEGSKSTRTVHVQAGERILKEQGFSLVSVTFKDTVEIELPRGFKVSSTGHHPVEGPALIEVRGKEGTCFSSVGGTTGSTHCFFVERTEGEPPGSRSARPNVQQLADCPSSYARLKWLEQPPSETRSRKATMRFESSRPDVTFECSNDKADFQPCRSPVLREELTDGYHALEVRMQVPKGCPDNEIAVTWYVGERPERPDVGDVPAPARD